jgi:hypothetical protein
MLPPAVRDYLACVLPMRSGAAFCLMPAVISVR